MKKFIFAFATLASLFILDGPASARSWYHCHCYYYHSYVRYFPHHYYSPYPNVFIEDAHVYVPPYYYYAPYSYVSDVLVHRSIEIGPTVPVVVTKPALTFTFTLL